MERDSARGHDEIINTALAIAEERDNMLSEIRDLLEAGKDQQAIPLMKRYCGLNDDKKGHRVNSRFN